MLKILFSGALWRTARPAKPADPFDHPAIRRMTPAERADLPTLRWQEGA